MLEPIKYLLRKEYFLEEQFSEPSMRYLPSSTGVYVITNAYEVIYVGKGNIHDRGIAHLNGDNPYILRKLPTQFWYKISYDMDTEEVKYIQMLNPTCNQRLG